MPSSSWRNGADEIVYPEKQMANWAAVRYSSDHIFDYIELARDYSIFETAVPSSWVGKTVVELSVRQTYRINILATRHGGHLELLPGGSHQFQPDETIYILGENKDVTKVSQKLNCINRRGPDTKMSKPRLRLSYPFCRTAPMQQQPVSLSQRYFTAVP